MSARRSPMSLRTLVLFGLAAAILVGLVVAPRASSAPDGLEKVAAEHGIDARQRDSPLAAGPLAEYRVAGVRSSALGTGLAGSIGIVVCFVMAGGLVMVTRRRGHSAPDPVGG